MGIFKKPCRFPGCVALTFDRFCQAHSAGVSHACAFARCPNMAAYGKKYCQEHEQQTAREYDKQRGSAQSRGYDAAWNKARAAYLAINPLCEDCSEIGRTTSAELVHHIVPLDQGGARLDFDNLRSLCVKCHERVHARLKGVKT